MKSYKSFFLGKSLSNEQLKNEKLSRTWGLPIMASDAVSSVAYAVEEILIALVPVLGYVATQYVGLVSIPIILLLIMLVFSYSQIINHYPDGGGAYVASKQNFGSKTSLVAAACLIIDYIMTVAVSISSSTAAIIAAFPALEPHRVIISLICISVITLINLRGMSESSKIFGVPTYLFILTMAILIITGFIKLMTGNLPPIEYSNIKNLLPAETLSGITILLFLKAFSAGCSALTGVEAVSNAVPNFKDPSVKTAKHVLYMLGIIIVFIFGGTSFLAGELKVLPVEGVTVISQMAQAVFGNGFMFYLLQITTALILLLAANTAYNGLPTLLSILSKDQYVPHQFSQRGAKLSFSNGIMFIYIIASFLLIIFNADTHALIPFYAVGVLVSFTLSQAGMFVKWFKEKETGWWYKSLINGFGALITFIGSIVVFVMKFTSGAWALLILIPLIMAFMSYTHRHYTNLKKTVSVDINNYKPSYNNYLAKLPCVVLVHNINKGTLKTIDFARSISSNIVALHISTTPKHTEKLREEWNVLNIDIPLKIVAAPFRDILPPLEEYVYEREKELQKGEKLTVLLTKYVGNHWHDKIFHNQTTFFIERKLGRHKNVATILVPFVY